MRQNDLIKKISVEISSKYFLKEITIGTLRDFFQKFYILYFSN